jgi:signal transduction histidine kinase
MGPDESHVPMTPPSSPSHRGGIAHSRSGDLERLPPPVVTGELVSAITHDLRQPLTAVEMNVSAAIVFLERATPQIGEAIEALNDALGQQRRMRDALQVLQHLAMHRGGSPGLESIDLNAVVREVVGLVSGDAHTRGIPLELNIEAGTGHIAGDVVLVRQALLNLVLGAIEATAISSRADAPVRVTVRRIEAHAPLADRPARLAGARHGTSVGEVAVTHFGERGAGTRPDDWGLALVRSVVAAHGATIAFEGNSVSGMTVITRWPIQSPEATTPASLADA